VTRWIRPPELERQRARDVFDPVAEGARYRLSPEVSIAIWDRTRGAATDAMGQLDLPHARLQFHQLASSVAARGGRLRPDVGRQTRVGVELGGDSLDRWRLDETASRTPGRGTLVMAEARRWEPSAFAAPADATLPGAREVAEAMAALARAGSHGAAAAAGVAGPSAPLPFADQIQSAFGHHDISYIRAHLGDEASSAADAIDARAYAMGNHVAFAGAPDLFTAAHEAAHVVQQRGGFARSSLFGPAGDDFELHADAVANAVIAGQSAQRLLDAMPRGDTAAIRRKGKDDKPASAPEPTLPDGVNMEIRSDGTVVARVAWLLSDPLKKAKPLGLAVPTRMTEILHALKAAGLFTWMEESQIAVASQMIGIYGGLHGSGKFTTLSIGFDLYAWIGPPPGADIVFAKSGSGLSVVIRQQMFIPGPVDRKQSIKLGDPLSRALWSALAGYTEMPIAADMMQALVNWSKDLDFTVSPDLRGVEAPLPEQLLVKIYGDKDWKDHLAHPKKEDGAAGVGQPITIGGVTFSAQVPEADRKYFLDWMKQLAGPGGAPGGTFVFPELVAKLRDIDSSPQKAQIIAKLKGAGGATGLLSTTELDNAIESARIDAVRGDVDLAAPAGKTHDPFWNEPVQGAIVNRGGLNYLGQTTELYWETHNERTTWGIPTISVQWLVTPKDKPKEHLKVGTTSQRGGEKPANFKFEWPSTGIYTIHAFVSHSSYQPTEKSIDVEVKTEAQRMTELDDGAYAGLKGDTTYATGDTGWPFDVSTFNTLFGSRKEEYGKRITGATPADYKRMTYDQRVKFLTDDEDQLEALIAAHKDSRDPHWKDMVSYAQDKLKSIRSTARELVAENLIGYTFFEARGVYLSRQNGIPDGTLKLVGSANKDGGSLKTFVRDFTQLFEPVNYTFSASSSTFEKAIEATFVDLCKSYPSGRVSCMFECLDDNGNPVARTISYEFDTATAWKDVKAVIYNPTVKLIVNIAAAATMVFLPMTAPVLLPMLAAYNSVDTLDNLADLSRKGNLTRGSVAKGVAEIGLNFLPYVGEMKAVAQLGKTAMYTLDAVMIGSSALLMTIDGVEQLRQLRDNDIGPIAKLDGEIRELERTNPSDPSIAGTFDKPIGAKRKQLAELIKHAQDESTRVIEGLAKSGGVLLMQMGALKALQAHMTTKSVEGLQREGVFAHGTGEPVYDPATATIRGDQTKLDAGKLAKLQQSYALDMAAKLTELQNVLGTDHVEIVRGGDALRVTKQGDGYKVEIPTEKPFAEALDEAWRVRKAVDPAAPDARPKPVIADVVGTFSGAEIASKQHIAVGRRVRNLGEAEALLKKLARGDVAALKELGVEPPPDFDLRTVEWGIGQLPDGSFVIVRGNAAEVDWSAFKGVRPIAHSHPLYGAKFLKKNVYLSDVIKNVEGEDVKIKVFISARDIAFTAEHFLGEHSVQTGYASKGGGLIGDPVPGAGEPLVVMKIQQPERLGSWAGNDKIGVYKARIVATDTNGKVLWSGDVYAVDHPAGSLLQLEPPADSLITKGDHDGARPGATKAGDHDATDPSATSEPAAKDPADPAKPSKPPAMTREGIPPGDRDKLHNHAKPLVAKKLAEKVKDPPPATVAAVEAEVIRAEEDMYLERAKTGAKPPNRLEPAKKAGGQVANAAVEREAVQLANQAADQAASDGSVFAQDELPGDARTALADFQAGRSGKAAKRLTPALEGKTADEMRAILDAEVKAGTATHDPHPVDDPTAPGAQQQQDVYNFSDGTMIRIKPRGDEYNPGIPMFSVEVRQAGHGGSLPGQDGVAFKVDARGNAVPKGGPKHEIKNPYAGGRYQDQYEAFEKRVLALGHRKAKP
jgi:hypothetical protein